MANGIIIVGNNGIITFAPPNNPDNYFDLGYNTGLPYDIELKNCIELIKFMLT
jgi:hypothetical protein